jgi:hypothetical protein
MAFQNQIIGLLQNIEKPNIPIEIDLVLEGGGFNGSYELGVLLMLKEMEKQNYIKINRFSGTSIGAILCVLYLFDDLDNYITYYKSIVESFKKHITLQNVHENINIVTKHLNDNIFQSIKDNVLYITYYNLTTKNQEMKCCFTDMDDLKNTLYKSSFIPFLINNELSFVENVKNSDEIDISNQSINTEKNTYEQHDFIDGGQPFIFYDREKSNRKKILYVSINQLYNLHKMIVIHSEKNPFGRILHGIIDSYEFFRKDFGYNQKTQFCSYVNDWNTIDFIMLRLKKIMFIFIVYFIYYSKHFYKYIEPYLQNIHLFSFIKPICKSLYNDLMLSQCLL